VISRQAGLGRKHHVGEEAVKSAAKWWRNDWLCWSVGVRNFGVLQHDTNDS